jgi:hypothetical protein
MVGIKTKRPLIVSIISIIGWIMVVLSFVYAFSPNVKKIGEFYPALYSFVVCLQFISFVGIWYMKKWGVHLLVIAFFSKNILLVFMNSFTYADITFLISAIFLIILLFFYRKMDINL